MPAITDEMKDRIREVSPIVEVAQEFMKLERRGSVYVAKCFNRHGGTPDAPIYDDSPSLTIYPDGNYFCYGCRLGSNEHGEQGPPDVFKLVQQYFRITAGEELSFYEAAKWLVDRAHRVAAEQGETCDLYLAPPVPPDPAVERQKEQKTEVNRQLYNNLMADPEARQYLYERGLTDEDFAKYRIGVTPQDHPWRMARNRIAFGIPEIRHDGQPPRTLGFSYRTLEDLGRDCEGPKYLLDSEKNNLTFSRDTTLYMMQNTRKEIRLKGFGHLVEGVMDTIWMDKVGISNAVAPFGTTLSDGQVEMLAKLTKNWKVWLEDEAAVVAFLQQLPKFLARGLNVEVIVTGGPDPDELCQEYGAAGILSYVATKSRPAVMYFLNEVGSSYDAALHRARTAAISHLIPMVQAIRNPAERAIFLRGVTDRFGFDLGWVEYTPPEPKQYRKQPSGPPVIARAQEQRRITARAAGA